MPTVTVGTAYADGLLGCADGWRPSPYNISPVVAGHHVQFHRQDGVLGQAGHPKAAAEQTVSSSQCSTIFLEKKDVAEIKFSMFRKKRA
jgi:hypothetical protein